MSKNKENIPKLFSSDSDHKKILEFRSKNPVDFSKFDLKKYEFNYLPLVTSRGCMRRCLFCNNLKIQKLFSIRDPKDVFKEMKYLYEKYKLKTFTLYDLLINADLDKLEELCDLIIDSELEIYWDGQMIIKDMSQELFYKLKKSGFTHARFGFETASAKVLSLMNKPHDAELAKDLFIKAKKADLNVMINILVGLPGEGRTEFNESVRFIKENYRLIDGIENLNTYVLIKGSLLDKLKDKFNITQTTDEYYDPFWFDDKGNKYKIRFKRYKKMKRLLKKLNKKVYVTNTYWKKLIR